MAEQSTINLLQTKTGLSGKLAQFEGQLRGAGLVALGGVLTLGVIVGALYFFFLWERGNLEQTKAGLIREITGARTKEGLQLLVKRRVAVVEKVRGTQRQLGAILDTIGTIAKPQQILAINYDEGQQIRLLVKTGSVEEAAGIFISMLRLVEEKRIVNPQLIGLQLGKDGSVKLTVSFAHASVGG